MTETLRAEELAALVSRVFVPRADEHAIAILVDLPDDVVGDTEPWKLRRAMAASWARELADGGRFEPSLVLYRNAHTNNGDLPADAWLAAPDRLAAGTAMVSHVGELAAQPTTSFDTIFQAHPLVMAPTELSATAPLKHATKRLGFRAATMPGFSAEMIGALRLDYGEINRRCMRLKSLLDGTTEARLTFDVEGEARCTLRLDLRHRSAHASGGVFPEPGMAGNLPSGETYIVPYEGEREGTPSRSEGELPVELDGELVIYEIVENRARRVRGAGAVAQREADRLAREPAYGNIAELGLGVLDAFGVEPTGVILLDEKLGLHVAFGRSDHFGGQVGPADFSSPDEVVHIDRVYVPRIQPRIRVASVDLTEESGNVVRLMRNGRYSIDFDAPR